MKVQIKRRVVDVDRHVGARIRERRVLLGLTQDSLAKLLGVTYQQAHKYERGINRVSAGRLFEIARVLSVPVSYFFEELDASDLCERPATPRQRMVLEVARNFAALPENHQNSVAQLVRSLLSVT